jgi:hypothetical protein
VLSRPYILASDNQLASITVGQEVPTIQNSRVTDTGQTINTLQYQDIGILLDVIRTQSGGLVIMDVAPEISALTGGSVPISDTASQPIIAKRSAQSRVSVRSGNTIVIGGLMEDRKTETINKVPILGDIPGIGALFRRKEVKKTKTELLIFLTPQVASRPESLPAMTKDELGAYKIAPNAVAPGAFDEHLRNMESRRRPGREQGGDEPADDAHDDSNAIAPLTGQRRARIEYPHAPQAPLRHDDRAQRVRRDVRRFARGVRHTANEAGRDEGRRSGDVVQSRPVRGASARLVRSVAHVLPRPSAVTDGAR